jgi:hypothetical protein
MTTELVGHIGAHHRETGPVVRSVLRRQERRGQYGTVPSAEDYSSGGRATTAWTIY